MQCMPRKISQPIVESPCLFLANQWSWSYISQSLYLFTQTLPTIAKGSIHYPVLGKTKILHCLLAAW